MQDYRNITGYIWFYFDYILPYFSPFFTPKTLISQKLLIVDTWNHSHWIRNGKVEISGQCDIFDLADVPPPPTRNNKVEISGQHDILVLMISQAGQWTQTPSTTPLQPKKWNARFFWITFYFWWSAGLVDGLEHHLPPLSSQKKWNAHF